MCTRIWCVRPVTGLQHTRQHPTPLTLSRGSAAAAGPQLSCAGGCWSLLLGVVLLGAAGLLAAASGQLVLTDSTCRELKEFEQSHI